MTCSSKNKKKITPTLLFLLILSVIISNSLSQSTEEDETEDLSLNNANLSSSKNTTMKLGLFKRVYGNNLNENTYYITMYLGETRDIQTYSLDTTSSITATLCEGCDECGIHLTHLHDFNSTYKILSCKAEACQQVGGKCINNTCSFDINERIDDRVLKGIFFETEVCFDPSYRLEWIKEKDLEDYILPLGCIKQINKNSYYEKLLPDGTLALSNSKKSFTDVILKEKLIKKNIFSLCFEQRGGYISFGEIFSLAHKEKNISYVPMLNQKDLIKYEDFYHLKIKAVKVQGEPILSSTYNNNYNSENNNPYNEYVAYINSASDVTYLPTEIYDKVITNFAIAMKENKFYTPRGHKNIKVNNGNNTNSTGTTTYINKNKNFTIEVEQRYGKFCIKGLDYNKPKNVRWFLNKFWPHLSFQFEGGYEFTMKPSNYYLNYSNRVENVYCLGIAHAKKEIDTDIVFGASFMSGYDIIFDREEQKIGFVESDCYMGGIIGEEMMLNRYNYSKRIREDVNVVNTNKKQVTRGENRKLLNKNIKDVKNINKTNGVINKNVHFGKYSKEKEKEKEQESIMHLNNLLIKTTGICFLTFIFSYAVFFFFFKKSNNNTFMDNGDRKSEGEEKGLNAKELIEEIKKKKTIN